MVHRLIALLILAVFFTVMGGCGFFRGSMINMTINPSITAPMNEFMYSCGQGGGPQYIYGFKVDPTTGELTPISGTMPTGSDCLQLGVIAFSPTNQMLVEYSWGNKVEVFTINSTTGALTELSNSPLIPTVQTFVLDPGNSFIFAINNATGGSMYTFPVNSSDTVSAAVGPTAFSGGGAKYGVAGGFGFTYITPNGKYIYAFDNTDSDFSAYAVQPGGSLNQVAVGVPASCVGTTNWGSYLISDPLSQYLYISCSNGGPSTIIPNQINAGGTLTPGTALSGVGSVNSGMAIDATGTYFYIQANGQGILGYQINPGGNLTALNGGVPYPPTGGSNGDQVTISPTNKFLISTATGGMNIFSIGSGGALILGPNSPVSAANSSDGAFDPSGKFMFAHDFATNIYGWSVNQTTGYLTPIAGVTPLSVSGPPGPFTFVVTPP